MGATGHADYASLEVTAAAIAAGSSGAWTKVGSLPDGLAVMLLNDLDAGGVKLYFTNKQGATAPAAATEAHIILAAGEPFFANYKSIGHLFSSCDVYVQSRAVEPASGSLRFTVLKLAPRNFRG